MKTIKTTFFISFIMVCFTINITQAQSLQETMQKLAKDAAIGYVQPIVSGFGANLNSGWMYKAPAAKKFGFDLDFGIVGMGTFMNSEAKKFARSGSFTFDHNQILQLTSGISDPVIRAAAINHLKNNPLTVSISGPTVVGAKTDSIRVKYSGGQVTVPGYGSVNLTPAQQVLPVTGLLENLPILPLGAPQLSIGTVYGTKMAIRYLPDVQLSPEIGKFSYFGFGIQHNPFMWISGITPPLDVSVGVFTQSMKVGKLFKSSTMMFGVQGSRTFGPGWINITPYAGLSLESSTMTFTYAYNSPNPTGAGTIPQNISFELKGENSLRATLGFSLKLAILKLNADYNIGKYNSVSAGLGIII